MTETTLDDDIIEGIAALREYGFDAVADDLADGVPVDTVLSRLEAIGEEVDDAFTILGNIGNPWLHADGSER